MVELLGDIISERQAAKLIGISAVSLMNYRKKNIWNESVNPIIKSFPKGNIRVFYKKVEFLKWSKNWVVKETGLFKILCQHLAVPKIVS